MGSGSSTVQEVEATVEAAVETATEKAVTIADVEANSVAGALHARIAELEAKVKALEEGAVAAVKEDVRQIANFLKTKYPYSL